MYETLSDSRRRSHLENLEKDYSLNAELLETYCEEAVAWLKKNNYGRLLY